MCYNFQNIKYVIYIYFKLLNLLLLLLEAIIIVFFFMNLFSDNHGNAWLL